MSGPTLLTPASRPLMPFPRAAAIAVAAATLAGLALPAAWTWAGAAARTVGVVGACLAAAWLEERLYHLFVPTRAGARLLLHLALPGMGVLAIGLPGGALASLTARLGDGQTLALCVGVGMWWFLSAALGTLVVVALDAAISSHVASFRDRIVLAVFGLLATVGALGAGLASAFGGLARALTEGGTDRVTFGAPDAAGSAALPLDADGAQVLSTLVVAIAAAFAVPAVVSACGKLAESLMERLYPLASGFDAVSQGRLDVRVEEAGSRDFVAVSRSFNAMVGSLDRARRLEHTFGRYVGQQLLGRLSAQGGEAAIPATSREASVFFADVRGFTSLSERLAPAQVLGLLNRYFERVVEVIDAHEGYLNKFVGDAVVVVFNGPVDQPDHAARAVRCAIALQQAVAQMNAQGLFPEAGGLQVGVGVSTGPVVAGNLGSAARQMEYTVIGDTVNLAARLTSKAPAGGVWVSEATARALPEELPRAALEPMAVKGKAQPVTPWQVWPAAAEQAA